ncbi:MAG TPA: hypothetical protein VFF16_17490 [Telluria sp.]|nr:hypothetical protein [Telluria sp.]
MQRTVLFGSLLLVAACSTTPRYDARFGDAVRQARLSMTVNPNAGANPDPVSGIDTQSALAAQKRYHDSFRSPPPVVNVINIGGGVTSNNAQGGGK